MRITSAEIPNVTHCILCVVCFDKCILSIRLACVSCVFELRTLFEFCSLEALSFPRAES